MNQETINFVCYLLSEEEWNSEIKTWVNYCLDKHNDYDEIFREVYEYFGDSWFDDVPFPPEVLEKVNIGESIRLLVEYCENSLTSFETEFLKEYKAA